MSHQGSAEVTLESVAPQVVLVPASALRVFVAMAIESDAGTGVFWHVNEAGEFAGPFMRESEVPSCPCCTCVQTHGAWSEMLHAARHLPVWAAVAAERTTSHGERWIALPKRVVQALAAPTSDPLWERFGAVSRWTGALIHSAFALLESEVIAEDLEDEQARRESAKAVVKEVVQ